jgi:hypothetical protein
LCQRDLVAEKCAFLDPAAADGVFELHAYLVA